MLTERPKPVDLIEMARRLRVTTKWLRREAEAGNIPHLRADNGFLFNAEVVEELLLQRAGQWHGLPPAKETQDGH